MQKLDSRVKTTMYIVGLTAALAGLLFGVDMGVISGALGFLAKDFSLSSAQQEMVVSAILVGAVIGSLCAGFISRHYGRRFAILLSAFIFSVGAILSALAVSYLMLLIVRVFLGVALGVASFTAPLYLSEVSPKHVRGGLISLYQLMITIGLFLAFVSDYLFSYTSSWRLMLGLPFIPAFIMFVAVLFLPKSPRWLMLKGHHDHAMAVLRNIHSSSDADEAAREILESVRTRTSMREIIGNKYFRKVVILGVVLQFIQQFSGMNTIMYYAPTIFKMAGFVTHTGQMWGTVIVGLVNVLTTIVAILVVDRLGRRPVLFFGSALMIVSMFALGVLFHIGVTTSVLQHVTVSFLLLFIVGFAISLGPVIWILCSEIFPLKGRDVGVTFSTTANWVANTMVGMTFLTFLSTLGTAGTFWLYGLLGVISLLIMIFFVPETKGISLEKIELNVLSGKRCRELGQPTQHCQSVNAACAKQPV